MANRYTYTPIKQTNSKKRYLSSTIYPKIQPNDDDMYIISDSSDRLDLLANKYYGDPSMWWIIATANNLNDANFFVGEGKQLRIPSNISKILNDLEKINR